MVSHPEPCWAVPELAPEAKARLHPESSDPVGRGASLSLLVDQLRHIVSAMGHFRSIGIAMATLPFHNEENTHGVQLLGCLICTLNTQKEMHILEASIVSCGQQPSLPCLGWALSFEDCPL